MRCSTSSVRGNDSKSSITSPAPLDSKNLTDSSSLRAASRQAIIFCGSPGRYGRTPENSSPPGAMPADSPSPLRVGGSGGASVSGDGYTTVDKAGCRYDQASHKPN